MANEEQLKILGQGVNIWNQWREDNPNTKINLRGANLKSKKLSGGNFQDADIRGTNFKNAILEEADFTRAQAGNNMLGKIVQLLLVASAYGIISALLFYSMNWFFSKIIEGWSPPIIVWRSSSFFLILCISCLFIGSIGLGVQKNKGSITTLLIAAVIVGAMILSMGAQILFANAESRAKSAVAWASADLEKASTELARVQTWHAKTKDEVAQLKLALEQTEPPIAFKEVLFQITSAELMANTAGSAVYGSTQAQAQAKAVLADAQAQLATAKIQARLSEQATMIVVTGSTVVAVITITAVITTVNAWGALVVTIMVVVVTFMIMFRPTFMPDLMLAKWWVYKRVEVLVMVTATNFSIVSLYVGFRTRHEDPQFALLRRLGLTLGTILGTNFREADLTNSTFNAACLKHTCFVNAKLNGVSWQETKYMNFVHFTGTILADRKVRELLVNGKGQGLSFRGKNLHGAYLVGNKLQNSDLREAELVQVNLSQADITGTKLYGSSRENWIIDDIKCDYVFFDEAGEARTPKDRDFKSGEFEELYKMLPTFEYVFDGGFTPIDAVVMDQVVQAINERHPEFRLDLVSFDKRGEPHATFTVLHGEDIKAAKEEVTNDYERRIIELEAQRDELRHVIKMLGSSGVRLKTGTTGDVLISLPLRQKIVSFLASLPSIYNAHGQRAFLSSAGLDENLLQQISVNEPPKLFAELLVSMCLEYGMLHNDQEAIEAVLEAAKQHVGVDKKALCDQFIQQFQNEQEPEDSNSSYFEGNK